MPTGPRKLGDVLKDLVDRLGIQPELDEAQIVEAWATIAGADTNRYTDSAWMRGRKLFVKLTSPVRRQQLHMNRSSLRDRLNLELGRDAVDEIIFR